MSRWPAVPIGQILDGLFDGPHATPAPAIEGPVFLGIKNITEDGRLDLAEVRHIAWEEYPRWIRRVEPQAGDLVFTYEASLHRYAIIPPGFKGCLGRRTALLRLNPARAITRFVLYYFLGPQWRSDVAGRVNIGSTVDRIPLTDFRTFPVHLPPLHAQIAIASTLAAYDELIENNVRRIGILEEMATSAYREWTEDKSVLQGSLPEPTIDPKVRQELRTVAFGDIVEEQRSSINPFHFPNDEFHHYSFAAYDDDKLPARQIGAELLAAKLVVNTPAVLLSKLNPHIPRVWLAWPFGDVRSIASSEFLVLEAKDGIPLSFVYETCRAERFRSGLTGMAAGTSTSHQRLRREDVMSAVVALPSSTSLRAFGRVVRPIHELQQNLARQNATLTATRDFLLPRLVSGEIDLSNSDIDIEWLAS